MRSIILVALLISSIRVYGFTDAVWQNIPPTYTNLLGMEFVNEVALRSQWAGTNWAYVSGGVSNVFGSVYRTATETGVVYFTSSGADEISHVLDSHFNSYIHPYFTSGSPEYSLNEWFSNYGNSNWPGYWSKAEFLTKTFTNAGMVFYGDNENNVTLGAITNGVNEVIRRYTIIGWDTNVVSVTNNYDPGPPESFDISIETNITPQYEIKDPQAVWIKRLDRVNPLVIATWSCDTNKSSWQYYEGYPNEFYSGKSTLYGLTANQNPFFIFHKGGDNNYSGGIQLESWYTLDEPISDLTSATEWRSNFLYGIDYQLEQELLNGITYTLSSVTQQCDRAWLSFESYIPFRVIGTPPNTYYATNYMTRITTNISEGVTNYIATNVIDGVAMKSSDLITLEYITKGNTYEGTEIWDKTLLPEQLNAHYSIMTNMFLTKRDWYWTNSVAYTSTASIVSFSDDTWPEERWSVTNVLPIYSATEECDPDAWTFSYPNVVEILSNYYYIIVCPVNVTNNMTQANYDYFYTGFNGSGVSTTRTISGYATVVSWRNSRDTGPEYLYETSSVSVAGTCESYTNFDATHNGLPSPRYNIYSGILCIDYTNDILRTHHIIPETTTHSWTETPIPAQSVEYYHEFTASSNGVVASHPDCLEPQDIPVPFLKLTGCPWIPDFYFPDTAAISSQTSANNQAPYFDYVLSGDIVVSQMYEAVTWYIPLQTNDGTYPATEWNWSASAKVVGAATMNGHGVDSAVCVDNLWTSTPHRVHFYAKPNFTNMTGGFTITNYYRSYVSPWTTSNVVISPPISCWSNFASGVFEAGDCYGAEGCQDINPAITFVRCEPAITNVRVFMTEKTSEMVGMATNSYNTIVDVAVLECSLTDPKEYDSVTNVYMELEPIWEDTVTTTAEGIVYLYQTDGTWIANGSYYNTGCQGVWDNVMTNISYAFTNYFWPASETSQTSYVVNDSGYSIGCERNWSHATASNEYSIASSNSYYSKFLSGPKILMDTIPPEQLSTNLETEYYINLPNEYGDNNKWLAGRKYVFEGGQYPVSTNKAYINRVNDVKVLVEWEH